MYGTRFRLVGKPFTDSVLLHITCCAVCWCADVVTIMRQVQAIARSASHTRMWTCMCRPVGIQCAESVVGPVDRDRSGIVCAAVWSSQCSSDGCGHAVPLQFGVKANCHSYIVPGC